MVQIHYAKIDDKKKHWAMGYCYNGLKDFSVDYISALVGNNNPPEYVSFDGKGIDLDNTSKKFYESGDYTGYVSDSVSDENNLMENYMSIELAGQNIDLTQGLTFHFYGNCCSEMIVRYKNENTETIQEDIIKLNSELFVLKSNIACASLEIIYTKTVLPNQFVKISYIKFGTVFIFDKIKSINLLEEINVLSEDLPINELEYNVVVNEPIDFKDNDLMYLYSNGRYYGTFYLDDAELVSKNPHTSKCVYSVKAQNSIKILENTEYKEWGTNATFKGLSNTIYVIK